MSHELKIALVQTSLLWEDPEGNRARLTTKIKSISSDVDLIILPEMFTTGFTMTPQNLSTTAGLETLEWLQEMAKATDSSLVGSIPFFENNNYTNRLFFVSPDGKTHQYDKKHTFTLAGEDRVYESGNKRLVVDYKGFKICPLICYDLRFPVWARYDEDYDVLLYVANWPKPRINAWDALLKARAIENMAYCIGVNRVGTDESGHEYSGHSAVYDALGAQIAYSEKEEVMYATLSKEHVESTRNKLKFLEDKDSFTLN